MSYGFDPNYSLQSETEFNVIAASIAAKFPDEHPEDWHSAAPARWHAIHLEPIASAIFRARPLYLDGISTLAMSRKYFMERAWVYDKVYLFTTKDTCQLAYPAGGSPLAIGQLINVYGQPGDADLSRYQDLYFMHPDHAAVEAWVGTSLPIGKYSTFYRASYDTLSPGSGLLQFKTYTYDEQTPYSDWDVVWLQFAKLEGILDSALAL